MKLLVVSDSHGVLTGMEQAVLREQPDLIYHLVHLFDFFSLRFIHK